MSNDKAYNSRNAAFGDWWRARLMKGERPLSEDEMGIALEAFNEGARWAVEFVDGELEAPDEAASGDSTDTRGTGGAE